MTFRPSTLFLAAAVCSTSLWGQQYTINLVSGNGVDGYAGDNAPAIAAQLSSPTGIAVDSSGKIYIADEGNNRVRVISKGNITTFAGNGTAGYTGDGAAATSAELYAPFGIAVDSAGNVYIADTQNNVVRMVDTKGNINTVAGTESAGGGYSGDGGPATAAQLFHPLGVAVDASGNLYIADAGNNLIRVVSGGEILTVGAGGNSSISLDVPRGLAVDAAGNLYVADTDNNRVVEYSTNGVWSVVAGGSVGFSGDQGPATKAQLSEPYSVAVDSQGQIYIADTLNSRIRKVSTAGTITTIAGNGAVGVYTGDGGAATSAGIYFPNGVAVDAAGNVYIADTHNDRLRVAQLVPSISTNAVVNAASFSAQLTPGALATVFGNTAGVTAGASLPLPTSLGGISVNVNGQPAPLLYVNPTQVNFQVPWETPIGTAAITITGNGLPGTASTSNALTSNTMSVPVLAAAPGLFQQGAGQALVQNADYSLNGPSAPAKVGSTITTYLTGSGPISSTLQDGVPTPLSPLVTLTSTVSATIGSATAKVSFAGLTPGLIGVVQMNVVIPSGLAAGAYPLTFTVGGQASNSATVSVTP